MVDESQIIIIVLFGTLFSVLMVTGMILFAKKNMELKALSAKLLKETKDKMELEKLEIAISTQEKERVEIARLLHDDVGALLSLAQKNLINFEDNARQGKVDYKAVELGKEYIAESIQKLRAITQGLAPHYLLKFGLVKALEKMTRQKSGLIIDSFNFTSKIPIKLQIFEPVSTHYFYITGELITNLIKHSLPTNIQMRLDYQTPFLRLKIRHNGIALTQSDFERLLVETDSFGLENIRYRLNILKGDLILKRYKTYGTIELITHLDKTELKDGEST